MQSCLQLIPDDVQRVFVAFSGGLDSSVLLHLLAADTRPFERIAWHVNHGLLDSAAQMEEFCHRQCDSYGLELRIDRLELGKLDSNIEAEARRQRYQLFAENTRAGDCILTAHHADDQAETFLLNALRASGSAGLRGIARQRRLGQTLLLRPLLDYSRAQLQDYARAQQIEWFDDPSNLSERFDRNYLRRQVLPRLQQRWPRCQQALANCAEIQAEIQDLLDEVAASDRARLGDAQATAATTLDVDGLLALSRGRCKNLLRYWIRQAGFAPPPQARLQELLRQLQARGDAMPEISLPDYALRLYDRRLFLVPSEAQPQPQAAYRFGTATRIDIDEIGLHLTRAEIFQRLGLEDEKQVLELKFRQCGENNPDRHRLKRLYQQNRVPPWRRGRIPQVYLDKQLRGLLL